MPKKWIRFSNCLNWPQPEYVPRKLITLASLLVNSSGLCMELSTSKWYSSLYFTTKNLHNCHTDGYIFFCYWEGLSKPFCSFPNQTVSTSTSTLNSRSSWHILIRLLRPGHRAANNSYSLPWFFSYTHTSKLIVLKHIHTYATLNIARTVLHVACDNFHSKVAPHLPAQTELPPLGSCQQFWSFSFVSRTSKAKLSKAELNIPSSLHSTTVCFSKSALLNIWH